MVDKMKGKKAVDINIPYFLEHAEEIINNTDAVLNPYIMRRLTFPEDGAYSGFYHMIEKKNKSTVGTGILFADQNIIQNLAKQKIKL